VERAFSLADELVPWLDSGGAAGLVETPGVEAATAGMSESRRTATNATTSHGAMVVACVRRYLLGEEGDPALGATVAEDHSAPCEEEIVAMVGVASSPRREILDPKPGTVEPYRIVRRAGAAARATSTPSELRWRPRSDCIAGRGGRCFRTRTLVKTYGPHGKSAPNSGAVSRPPSREESRERTRRNLPRSGARAGPRSDG
jgi:hypothetical protein